MRMFARYKLEIWGLACATGAVGLGLAYLAAAGAPVRMIAMNAAAYLVGLAAYATIVAPRWRIGGLRALMLPALALTLLLTTLAGTPVAGAARWTSIGPLTLQLSLILLPAMLILFARSPSASGAAGLAIAALALALQPDRAMAGALAAALAMLAACRRDRPTKLALAAAVGAFAATLILPDRLPAVPFVDQVFYSSFHIHPVAGGALLLGAGLLIVPALIGARVEAAREVSLAFGALWLAMIVAAALGNYPTPVVGYGGSAIVGYLLSLALARPTARSAITAQPDAGPVARGDDGRSLSASLA
jgi:hypothetical protein